MSKKQQKSKKPIQWSKSPLACMATENVGLLQQPDRMSLNSPEIDNIALQEERLYLDYIYAKLKYKHRMPYKTALASIKPLSDDSIFDIKMTPFEYFGACQFSHAAMEIKGRMARNLLDCFDFRDHIENLYCLYSYFVHAGADTAAKSLAEDVNNLLRSVGMFIELLEKYSKNRVTNWTKVATLFDVYKKLPDTCAKMKPPEIKWFSSEFLLGVGGFGSVYRCQLIKGPMVAVKLISRTRFKDDSYTAAGRIAGAFLNSVNICRTYASFVTEDCYVSVMEWLDGVNLSAVIADLGSIPINYIRVISAQICLAIKYIHYMGFIHRDIKPSNIMILTGCRVKLIDFDTVKVCIGKYSRKKDFKGFFRRTARETKDKKSPGTLMYVPPEVLLGASYGRAVDWWAVGIIIYQMHCTFLPFQEVDPEMTKEKIVDGKLEWRGIFCVPEDLRSIVSSFLIKNQSERLGVISYEDIQSHIFFRKIDWNTWEKGRGVLEWPALNLLISDEYRKDYYERNKTTPISLRCQKETQEQPSLYQYISPGFKKVVNKLDQNESVVLEDLAEDFDTLEDAPQSYMFEKFSS